MHTLKYLSGYPETVKTQVHRLVQETRLGEYLLKKHHTAAHGIRTDKALYDYVIELKNDFLRSSEPLSKVTFDSKLHVIQHALGTHSTVSRVQGGKLKSKREIRIASLFRDTPAGFLKMITVHELAHLKERQHDKAFYQLCTHMEPDYHLLEGERRRYRTLRDLVGPLAWPKATDAPASGQ